jgi:hypothetical protein
MTNPQLYKDLVELDKVFALPENWAQNGYFKSPTCMCLAAGMINVVTGETKYHSGHVFLEPRMQQMRNALGFVNFGDLIKWNDSGVTNFKTIKRHIKAAIKSHTPAGTVKPKRKYNRKPK